MSAVSHCLQDAYKHIVHDKAQRSHKIDPEICSGFRHDIFRSFHPHQNLRCKKYSYNRQNDTCHDSKSNCRMYRFLNVFRISRPKVSCNHHTGSQRDAIKKSNHQLNQVPRRTDCRKCVTPKKIPHNQRVRRIIHLLKQIPQKNRYCKKDNPFPDGAFCHQCAGCPLFHPTIPPSLSIFFRMLHISSASRPACSLADVGSLFLVGKVFLSVRPTVLSA